MGKRIVVILASLALLYSFGIDEALSQVNVSPPLWPPEYVIGDATIGGQSAQGGDVYLKMMQLCVIFLDGLNDQGDITNIVNGLNAADTTSLALAFSNSIFCQNYDPPLELPGPATVSQLSPTEWEVTDPSGRFYVFTENIKIWQGGSWVPGYKKLQVNMYNGKVASSPISSGSSPYLLEVPVNPEGILWGDETYILLEEGRAMLNDPGYFYIKKDGIERRVTTVDGQEITPHYVVGQGPFSDLDLDAPELIPLSIPLEEGFNLFSIPFNLPDTDINVVLADIIDCMESILAFRDDEWYISVPKQAGGWTAEQIGNINGGEAFVIYMTCADTLEVAGTPLESNQTTVILQQGFNLAPYNSASEKTVDEAFAGVRNNLEGILIYDEGDWQLCVPNPAGGWKVNQFQTVWPGLGFVIYSFSDNVVWDVGQ